MKYQLAENQELESCFDCPLSHKCLVVKGCTNEQAEWHAGRIPQECPLEIDQNCKQKGSDGDMVDKKWIYFWAGWFLGSALTWIIAFACNALV